MQHAGFKFPDQVLNQNSLQWKYRVSATVQLPCAIGIPYLQTMKKSGVKQLAHSHSFTIPWTVACQAPLFMGFARQEYWTGVPFLSPGDLPDPGIKPGSPALAGSFFTTEPAGVSSGR